MGNTRKILHSSLTQPPPSTHHHHQQDRTLAPSMISSTPGKLPLPESENILSGEATASSGMAPPERVNKMSDSDSGTAESLIRQDSLVEPNSDWSDEEASGKSGLPLMSLATGLCYDVQMRYHCEIRPTSDVHPEDPRRIYYIYKELCRSGLVDDPESNRPLALQPLRRIHARLAKEEEIMLIHSEAHYAFVRSTEGIV